MRTAIIFAGLAAILGVQVAFIPGEPPKKAQSQPVSEAPAPAVLAAKEESAPQIKEIQTKSQSNGLQNYGIKGPLMIFSKQGSSYSGALAHPALVAFGGKTFVTGEEFSSSFTVARYPGRKIWIPLEDVSQMVELTEKDAVEKSAAK